jgi:hypothetical protein
LTQFINLAGGEKANILIIAAGYPSEQVAESSKKYRKARYNSSTLAVQDTSEQPALPEIFLKTSPGLYWLGRINLKLNQRFARYKASLAKWRPTPGRQCRRWL